MSHKILIEALVLTVGDDYGTVNAAAVAALLTTQRQIFNSVAPILPSKRWLMTYGSSPELVFRLLMRADTFRFATSLYAGFRVTTALAQEVMSKMDYVITVEIASSHVDDSLTPPLMALAHLERVTWFHVGENVTYHGMLRPLLKHPRESVRRSAAESAASFWFEQLSIEQFVAAFRDDIIPLIDSASCNAAVVDYLQLLNAALYRWKQLPREIIMMLGDRLFQFFTAENSHWKLVDISLDLLAQILDNTTQAQRSDDVVVDVFREWPVLELLPGMIRCGLVLPAEFGVDSVINTIFQTRGYSNETTNSMLHYRQRFFQLQLPDLIYDSCFPRSESPFESSIMSLSFVKPGRFPDIARADSVSLLLNTTVFQQEIRRFLIPCHRDIMSLNMRLKRRGELVVGEHGELLGPFRKYAFDRRLGAASVIIDDLLCPVLERCEPNEMSLVLPLLFDEDQGLNLSPILRSFLMVVRQPISPDDERDNPFRSIMTRQQKCNADIVCRLFSSAEFALEVERQICATEPLRGRRERECGHSITRRYLAEFLASLGSLRCQSCGRAARRTTPQA